MEYWRDGVMRFSAIYLGRTQSLSRCRFAAGQHPNTPVLRHAITPLATSQGAAACPPLSGCTTTGTGAIEYG
jgi:hypothetical protein